MSESIVISLPKNLKDYLDMEKKIKKYTHSQLIENMILDFYTILNGEVS